MGHDHEKKQYIENYQMIRLIYSYLLHLPLKQIIDNHCFENRNRKGYELNLIMNRITNCKFFLIIMKIIKNKKEQSSYS